MATYQEQTTGTLPFYNEAMQRLLQKGEQQAMAGMGTKVPTQGVAGFNPQQQQAFDLAGSLVGKYQPLLDQSQAAYQQSIAGAQFDPSQIQQYLNPYLTGVVDEIGRLGQQGFQEQIAPSISSQFGGLGQYGSARQAMALAEAGGRSQRETLGQQSQALSNAYNQAMQNYGNWAQMGIGANQQAGQAFGNLAQAQQQLGLGDIGMLGSAGSQQQALEQQKLNAQYQQWQQQQQYPWEQLNQWASLFKAGTPQTSTQWSTGFKKGGLAKYRGYADGGRFRDEEELERLLAERPDLADDPTFRALAREVAMNESSGRRDAVGPIVPSGMHKGDRAVGMFQLMPKTAADMGVGDITDIDAMNAAGLNYLAQNYLDFERDPKLAAIAHIGGPGAARRFQRTGDLGGLKDRATGLLAADYANDVTGGMPTTPTVPTVLDNPENAQLVASSDLARSNIDLPRRAFDERIALLERARSSPEFAALPERSTMDRLAEAMYRSAAEGPGNIGQLIGRAGKAYYDTEAAEQAENKKRALERLAIEERILPDINRVGIGSGAVGRYKQVSAGGKTYLYDDLTGEMNMIGESIDDRLKREQDADKYATELIKDAQYKTEGKRKAAYEKLKQDYMMGRVQRASSGKIAPEPGAPVMESVSAGPNASDAIIQTEAEKAESKGFGEGQIGRFNKVIESGAQGYSMLDTLANMEGNLEGYRTGTFAPLVKSAFGVLAYAGMPVDETLGNKEAFEAAANKMALQLRLAGENNLMPGAMSDSDREYLKKIAPSMTNTPEGNKLIIDLYRKIAQRQIEKAEFAEEYQATHPRGSTVGFERAWRERTGKSHMFPDPKTLDKKPEETKRRKFNPESGRIE